MLLSSSASDTATGGCVLLKPKLWLIDLFVDNVGSDNNFVKPVLGMICRCSSNNLALNRLNIVFISVKENQVEKMTKTWTMFVLFVLT